MTTQFAKRKTEVQFFLILFWIGLTCFFSNPKIFAAEATVDPAALTEIADKNITSVPEFAAIAKEAHARGLRVWMLGGAASSFVDHAKQHILRPENSARLEWSLNNIIMPEQDVDLVITKADGTPESAKEVQEFLSWVRTSYPYKVDGKSRWEAMGLMTSVQSGKKMAIGADPDFLRQNNDTLSLGMAELTIPPGGQSRFLNMGLKGDFVSDIAQSQFHFLPSLEHQSTARFKEGMNPPILSVIRSLEKATRYNIALDPGSFAKMKEIIAEWNPNSAMDSSYVYNYLHGRGKRVITHAQDIESAQKLIDDLGLRKKLLQLPGSSKEQQDSLAWWLNRKPLPYEATEGIATGQTAESLGIKKAYHWTSAANQRLITWNYNGRPRLLESRNEAKGETARIGNGFYTVANDPKNIKNTYTKNNDAYVSFDVDPKAQEGIDFTYDKNMEILVWKSAKPLTVEHQKVAYPENFQCSTAFAALPSLFQAPQHPPMGPIEKFVTKHIYLSTAVVTGSGVGLFKYLYSGDPPQPRTINTEPALTFIASKGNEEMNALAKKTLEAFPNSPLATDMAPLYSFADLYAKPGAAACGMHLLDIARIDPSSEPAQKICALSGIAALNDFLAAALSVYAYKNWSIGGIEKILPVYSAPLAQDCGRALLKYNFTPFTDSNAKNCAAVAGPANVALLHKNLAKVAKTLRYFPNLDIGFASIEPMTKAQSPATLECRNILADNDAFSFDDFARKTCEQAQVENTNKILGATVALYHSKSWEPETIAANIGLYASPLAQECGQILLQNGIPLMSEANAKACAALQDRTNLPLLARTLKQFKAVVKPTEKLPPIATILQAESPEELGCRNTLIDQSFYPFTEYANKLCASPENEWALKLQAEALSLYERKHWDKADFADNIFTYSSELSRDCARILINNELPLMKAKYASSCAALSTKDNLPLVEKTASFLRESSLPAESFEGVTKAQSPEALACRTTMVENGFPPHRDFADKLCDPKNDFAQKLFGPLVTLYKARNWKTDSIGENIFIYNNELSQACGRILLLNNLSPVTNKNAKACGAIGGQENLALLEKTIAYVRKSDLSLGPIEPVTKAQNPVALACRNTLVDHDHSPFSSFARSVCENPKNEVAQKLLGPALALYDKNNWKTDRFIDRLQLYNTDAAVACGLSQLGKNKSLFGDESLNACHIAVPKDTAKPSP